MKQLTLIQAYAIDVMRRFHSEEEGLALTEYLVVLGLLVGGVIAAVLLFGQGLSTAWNNWTDWVTGTLGAVPT